MKFEEAIKHSIEYLKSSEFRDREDAQTTIKSLPILIKINSDGFLTDNSQEGMIIKGYNPDTKTYYEIKERSYITGFLKKEQGHALIHWINMNTEMTAFEVLNEPTDFFENLYMKDSIQYIPNIIVTASRSSKVKEELSKVAFSKNTQLIVALPEIIMNNLKKQLKIDKSEKTIYINIFDAKYGRRASSKDGLFHAVLKGLSQSNRL